MPSLWICDMGGKNLVHSSKQLFHICYWNLCQRHKECKKQFFIYEISDIKICGWLERLRRTTSLMWSKSKNPAHPAAHPSTSWGFCPDQLQTCFRIQLLIWNVNTGIYEDEKSTVVGGELIGKARDGNVLYLIWDSGYMGIYNDQNSTN